MKILFAICSIMLGAALLCSGYRTARALIPFFGIVTAILIGEAVVRMVIATPLIALIMGGATAITLAFTFALLTSGYYPLAIVILYGSLGYWLGESVAISLNISTPPLFLGTVGFVVGGLVGVGILMTKASKGPLIVGTSFAGAVALVSGVLLLFNQMGIVTEPSITSAMIWIIATGVMTGVGIFLQRALTRRYILETWNVIFIK